MAKGSITYHDDARKAAAQASLDLAAFTKRLSTPTSPEAGAVTDILGAVWGGIGSLSSLAGLGVSISNLVLSRFPATPEAPVNDALEIQVVNNTSAPVVPFSWSVSEGDRLVRVPGPLAAGDADIAVIANTDGGFDSSTALTLSLLVGVGENTVEVTVSFGYNDADQWQISAGIDTGGKASHDFDSDLEIAGASFVADAGTAYPSFSFYTATTQSPTSNIVLALYDYAAAPTA